MDITKTCEALFSASQLEKSLKYKDAQKLELEILTEDKMQEINTLTGQKNDRRYMAYLLLAYGNEIRNKQK